MIRLDILNALDTVVHGLVPEDEIQDAKLKFLQHIFLKVKLIEANNFNSKVLLSGEFIRLAKEFKYK